MVRIGAVLLAAGKSTRFGKNKLLVDIKNKPMICYALDALKTVPGLELAAVVSDEAVAACVRAQDVRVIVNEYPERGQAHSIVLAVQAMRGMHALLLCAGDQPKLSSASLARLVDAFAASKKGLACLADETHRGNPAIFASIYYDALEALQGDCGAKRILRAHEDDLLVVPCLLPYELADADTPDALAAIMGE